jgi:hypothetical protein
VANEPISEIFSILFVMLVLGFVLSSYVFAQQEKKDLRPERGIAVYPEYSAVTVSKGEDVNMDLMLKIKAERMRRSM